MRNYQLKNTRTGGVVNVSGMLRTTTVLQDLGFKGRTLQRALNLTPGNVGIFTPDYKDAPAYHITRFEGEFPADAKD